MDAQAIAALIVKRLRLESADLSARFAAPVGTTTRHVAIDGLLPDTLAHQIAAGFETGDEHFLRRDSFRERKRTCTALGKLDPVLGAISFAIQDPAVVAIVGEITGMKALEPDASLYAGGLSVMHRGDFLNPHIDNSHDGPRERYRRLNLLYYIAPDWREENGGNLELWDADVRVPVTITSAFNRLVLMETSKTSHHSVSPVKVDRQRRCVSAYYFSRVSPDATEYFHITAFTARPEQPVRRLISRADAALRGVAGGLGLGRGKGQTYRAAPPGDEAPPAVRD